MMPRILAFAGSLRRDSFNKKLASIAAHGARALLGKDQS
jgi:NAD(P)H-dependent FMN reductase